ncbi:MAG: ABC transporter substrate-binding protein [Acidaminococcaceae bacterium]|nr:ABC transporter substrate-binding protein [Acidaminococcaceae bacterium]
MKKTYVAGSLMLVMALMMAGCGGGDKKADAPKKDAPKAAAATDTVMLYSSMQEDQLNAVKKAFEKKYPNIKMDYYFAGTGKVKTKIFTEAKGGQVAADVIWVGDPADYIGFKADGKILQKYESPEAKNIDKAFIDPEGFYTGARMMNMGIAYNTTKVKKEEAPKTWNDLLDPKWKGQIVMTDPGTAGTTKYAVGALMASKDYGPAYFEKLKANGTELQSGTTASHNQIAAGAYKVGMCLDYVTNNLKAKGSTIDFVYLDKDIVSIFSPVALVKGAKNEKNGKLLIDFILSKEGQEVLVANNLLSVRKDVKQKGESAETIAKRAMKVDLQALATGSKDMLKQFDGIFKKK